MRILMCWSPLPPPKSDASEDRLGARRAGSEHGVGEVVELVEPSNGRVEQQCVESEVTVCLHGGCGVFWGGQHVGDVERGILWREAVVASQVFMSVVHCAIIAERIIHAGVQPGRARTAALLPRAVYSPHQHCLVGVVTQCARAPAVRRISSTV